MVKMKKSNKDNVRSTVSKGEVYWFDPLKKTEENVSPLVVILSGKVHNKFSSNVIFNTASSQNVETVRKFFEVACEIANKKIKVSASVIHMLRKKTFLEKAIYLGELRPEKVKEINEKIKLILDLD
ncbi:type II toxin-antitoxin system PemK/MazF family toxin [endosymbiont GvMRE of Glomus versiforme]|uniref:type II toxin-antitoxin system PemK/MazF family toxin n=1 Tax=endosymbiont GvMRE of Glomus versiforme TaxID=2039283 RepID=UPI000ECE2370|nr:type II toxin-antitoxin system PemK/MazF family toxin [endosymbiont GvMRE of Glomus versiforme]RHZ36141.1 hypothetical protein GvMRE_Ic2g122 [endosymbiont GvMRE of Glomus versiforme]